MPRAATLRLATPFVGLVVVALVSASDRGAAQGPITLSIIDVAGDLTSTRQIIENYKAAHPQKVKAINYQLAPAPELPAKLKAQQDAGRLDINLLLTGQDAGSVLVNNGQVIKLFPKYEKLFPKEALTDAAQVLFTEGEGYLMPSVVFNGGPGRYARDRAHLIVRQRVPLHVRRPAASKTSRPRRLV